MKAYEGQLDHSAFECNRLKATMEKMANDKERFIQLNSQKIEDQKKEIEAVRFTYISFTCTLLFTYIQGFTYISLSIYTLWSTNILLFTFLPFYGLLNQISPPQQIEAFLGSLSLTFLLIYTNIYIYIFSM